MGNHMNTLEQIKRETRDDADCMPVSGIFMIREFHAFSDLKALIPDTDGPENSYS